MKTPIFPTLLTCCSVAMITPASAGEFDNKLTGEFEAGIYAKQLPYRFQAPKTIAPGKEYPLLLFLHGHGECGDDNNSQLKHVPVRLAPAGTFEKNPCFVIAPQCPKDAWWAGGPLTQALDLIGKAIKELPVDKKRVYITGLSMGGFGTWTALAQDHRLFAAAVPICGGGDPATVKKFNKVPVWAFHGDADPAVAVAKTREMVEALKKEGSPVLYTEYPGVRHDSWTKTYQNPKLYEWLFSQKN